jgi:hypothetical protein
LCGEVEQYDILVWTLLLELDKNDCFYSQAQYINAHDQLVDNKLDLGGVPPAAEEDEDCSLQQDDEDEEGHFRVGPVEGV